jgi:hypothetical protein
MPERRKSPISAHNPAAVSVSIPRRHISRRAVCAHGELRSAPAISASSCSRRIINACTAPRSSYNARCGAACSRHTPASQPRCPGPVGLRAVEAHLVAQQQLGQAMARAHQIGAQILTGTHQVAQRLSCTPGTATR